MKAAPTWNTCELSNLKCSVDRIYNVTWKPINICERKWKKKNHSTKWLEAMSCLIMINTSMFVENEYIDLIERKRTWLELLGGGDIMRVTGKFLEI